MHLGNFRFALFGSTLNGDDRGTVHTMVQRPDKIRLPPHPTVIPAWVDKICPDITEHVDSDGGIHRNKRAVHPNGICGVGVSGRTHLNSGAHVGEIIQLPGTHDQACGTVAQIGLLFAVGDNSSLFKQHQAIAVEFGLHPQIFITGAFNGADDGIRNFADADLDGDAIVDKMFCNQLADSALLRR